MSPRFSLRERFHLWRAMRKYNPAGSFERLEGETKAAPRVIKTLSPKRRWWNWFWDIPRDLYPDEDRQKMKSLRGLPKFKQTCQVCVEYPRTWHCHDCGGINSHLASCTEHVIKARTYGSPAQGKTYSYAKAGEVFLPSSKPTAEQIERSNAKIGYHSFPTTECHECGSQVVESATHEQHWDGCSYHADTKAARKAEARRDILTTKLNLRRLDAAKIKEAWDERGIEFETIRNGAGEEWIIPTRIPEAKVIIPDSMPEALDAIKVRWDSEEQRLYVDDPGHPNDGAIVAAPPVTSLAGY